MCPEADGGSVEERGGEVAGSALVGEVAEYLVGLDGPTLLEVSVHGWGEG